MAVHFFNAVGVQFRLLLSFVRVSGCSFHFDNRKRLTVVANKRKKASDEELIIIPNAHEPIIPRDVFEAVQHQMKLRSKTIPAPKRHLFTNIAYCADCGKDMWYRSNHKVICAVDMPDSAKKLVAAMSSKRKYLNRPSFMTSSLSCSKLIKKLDKINKKIDALKARKRKYIELLADEKIT